FLCPLADLQCENGTWLSNPDCPAYSSLDSSGRQRLSVEEASTRGFPYFEIEIKTQRDSWHGDVCTALSHFHADKELDPNSQDIARHLGYPIYEL
ncbi:hypothetical protein C8R44DRAFT_549620, partial [Mycena epipterygia]